MSNQAQALPVDLEAVNKFWFECWEAIDNHSNSALFGEQENAGLIPPFFQYSQNRAEANRVARDVVAGTRTTWKTPEGDFVQAGEAIPAVGDLSIICDGDGNPVALLCDTDVRVQAGNHSTGTVIETFEVLYSSPSH